MSAEIIMLGTGNAMVTKCYNTCFAIRNNNKYMLVDAGGGNTIMTQLEKAYISYKDIEGMFITHGHTDHILGAIWIVRKIASLMDLGKYVGNFNIYCHDEAAEMLKVFCNYTLVSKFTKYIGDRIMINVIRDGDKVNIAGIDIRAFDIQSSKAKQFGFKAQIRDYRLVCLGDEPYNPECNVDIENCDLLMSEAFCLYEDREVFKPYEKHHSTAKDAGRLASEFGAKSLLIYHTEDTKLADRKQLYSKEVHSEYKGCVYIPDDLERICIIP